MATITASRPSSKAKSPPVFEVKETEPERLGNLATFRLTGVSDYSQSQPLDPDTMKPREKPAEWDERLWKEKAHWDDNDQMILPGMALVLAMIAACKKYGHKIPGRGLKTYASFFEAGLMCAENIPLFDLTGQPITRANVQSVRVHCASQGQKGSTGGSRVFRRFPLVKGWQTEDITIEVLDDMIGRDIFQRVLVEAGTMIGLGRWRPENRGRNGRFILTDGKLDWRK